MIKKFSRRLDPIKDLVLLLPLFFAGIVMKKFRRIGAHRLPLSRACLLWIGVFPIRDHYYEPMFHPRHLRYPLDTDRDLPGIDWNDDGQLALLETMNYAKEIEGRWHAPGPPPQFHIDNGSFGPGDADYWYNVVRHFKPARIIEVGSATQRLLRDRRLIETAKRIQRMPASIFVSSHMNGFGWRKSVSGLCAT